MLSTMQTKHSERINKRKNSIFFNENDQQQKKTNFVAMK